MIDYHGILIDLKALLEHEDNLAGVPVYVEEEPTFDLHGAGKAIVIVLDSRTTPSGEQPISQGQRTRFHIRIAVWAVGFDLKFEEAAKKRDELVGQLDISLMRNRTVNGKLAHSWLMGGAFIPVQGSQGMYAMAENILTGEATAIVT